jgi:hypothetical protein
MMLRLSLRLVNRSHKSIFQFSSQASSLNNIPSDVLKYKESDLVTNEEALQFKKYFRSHFLKEKCDNIQVVRTGTFIPLSSEDLKNSLPEGVPTSVSEEFEHTGKQMWMVRESTKLLCKLIDESEKTLVRKSSTEIPTTIEIPATTEIPTTLEMPAASPEMPSASPEIPSASPEIPAASPEIQAYPPINIPKFTDRAEWATSKIKCHHFGIDLMTADVSKNNKNETESSSNNDDQGVVDLDSRQPSATDVSNNSKRDEGELNVDDIVSRLSGKFPDKIVLTGKLCGVFEVLGYIISSLYGRQTWCGEICSTEPSSYSCAQTWVVMSLRFQCLGSCTQRTIHRSCCRDEQRREWGRTL